VGSVVVTGVVVVDVVEEMMAQEMVVSLFSSIKSSFLVQPADADQVKEEQDRGFSSQQLTQQL